MNEFEGHWQSQCTCRVHTRGDHHDGALELEAETLTLSLCKIAQSSRGSTRMDDSDVGNCCWIRDESSFKFKLNSQSGSKLLF